MLGRRLFLARLGALGAAAAAGPGLNLLLAAAPKPEGELGRQAVSGRGTVQDVREEIKEYKDPKTGARIRQLTAGGSNNVHPYFTSWGFVGDGADHAIIVSNRSGAW